MKRFFKVLTMISAVALAATAFVAAAASAATFTWSESGDLTGTSTSAQVFTTGGGGSVACTGAHTTGTITSIEGASQEMTVKYSGCKAFGFASATVSEATYEFYANGEVDVLNTIKITVPLGFCSVSVAPQEGLESVSYSNSGSKIAQSSAISGIVSTHSGGLCSSGSNGTYTGSNLVERVGGGSIAWDE